MKRISLRLNMRNLFPGYYKPSDDDFSKLWQNCIFTFDANMLLHVYRYTPETRENFFKTLEYLQERIWIPYQAASEYQEQRLKVIFDQHKAYSIVIKLLDNSIKEIKRGLEPYKKRHTLINAEKLVTIITKAIDEAKQEIQNAKRQHPNLRISDILREKIDEMFDGKIGKPYTEEELEKKYKEAEIRFERQIPPGYQDAYKDGTKKFGDVILWFQLIDHAHAQHKPIIFVTDDTKSDWWQFDDENQSIIGPRPELIQEMFVKTSMSFDIYQGYEFMAQAQKFLHLAEYPNVIEEIKEIGRQSNNFASLWFDRAEEAFSAFFQKETLPITTLIISFYSEHENAISRGCHLLTINGSTSPPAYLQVSYPREIQMMTILNISSCNAHENNIKQDYLPTLKLTKTWKNTWTF